MPTLWQSLAVLVVAISTHYAVMKVEAGGIQSGPSSGAMYAGGDVLRYDTLYVTGIHYNDDIESNKISKTFSGTSSTESSSCFVASMRLEPVDNGSSFEFGGIGDWRNSVNDVDQESCMALAMRKPSQIVVIGTKEVSVPEKPPLEDRVFDRNSLDKKLSDTALVDQDEAMTQLVYPVSIASDSKSSDFMYMVVLASKDAQDNSASASGEYPDWLKMQRYGSAFDMHVSKIKLSQGDGGAFDGIAMGSITASKVWTKELPLDNPMDRVFIGGIIHKITSDNKNLVIVVGSTRGSGKGYGLSDGNDEDGFVTVIDPSTGEILGDGAREGSDEDDIEGSDEDDIVTGLCDDPNDPDHFFIVGATEGQMGMQQGDVNSVNVPTETLQPFLRQIRADRSSSDDDNLWTMQWAVTSGKVSNPAYGSAIGCAVDGRYVYVAGTVENGASLVQGQAVVESQGGDDVWIAKIDKATRQVQWISQLGSDGDDRLARYGGISVDSAGNPIIYGDTNGDIYRSRGSAEDDSVEDMFVMSLDKDNGKILNNSPDEFVGGISTLMVGTDTYGDDVTNYPTDFGTDAPTWYPTDVFEGDGDDDGLYEHFYSPVGLQIQGPAHAGGIEYDSLANTILLTGATFIDGDMGMNPTSLCFTGLVDLDSGDLLEKIPRGSQNFGEACSSIAFDANRNAAYAVGVAEANNQGNFEVSDDGDRIGAVGGAAWDQGASNAVSGGIILQLNEDIELLGGNRAVEYPTVYPVSVVTHPLDKDFVFVASMASKKTNVNGASGNILERDNRKYGSEFFLMINQYEVTRVPDDSSPSPPDTLQKAWSADFSTDGGHDVLVGGMVMAGSGNVLVVVGSTRGEGGPFDSNEGSEDMDGFIVKIDPTNGQVYSDDGKYSTRLDSVNKKDDYILNVCNDRFDHDSIYVVGKSEGHIRDLSDADQPPEGSTHAYVAKVDLETMRAQWLKHFTMSIPGNGMMHGEALACTVTHDDDGENIVYVGGTLKDGASLNSDDGPMVSHGKDDIFVAAMNGKTGHMTWIQQIGTSQNDRLAVGQGLDVDSFGNVIVYAETNGDFYAEHNGDSDASDLVVLTVNKLDGTYLTPRTDGEGVGSAVVVEDNTSTNDIPKNGIPAIQTNNDKIPSYAGGMHYDQFTNAIYLTGATYTVDNERVSKTSQCFFGIATLPQLQWKQTETMGSSRAPEACSSISLANYDGESEPIIVGSSEKAGLLDNLRTARRTSQYGMVLDLQNNGGFFDLVGGTVVDDDNVQFPVKVIGDDDKVYLVSMVSKSDEVQPDAEKSDGRKYPNLTTGGIQKYGSQYEILVERHTITREADLPAGSTESTMKLDWRKPLETADQRSIFVSGMAVIDGGDALVVVGSTQGAAEDDDFDGIMAKVSTGNGSFASEGPQSRSVAYFSSVSGANDWILSVCPDIDDDRYFYVTGATGGQMDDSVEKADDDVTVHAVVSKIQASTLNIVWTTQYEVTHASGSTDQEAASVALGCAKVPDKGYLYVAGDVENGAILEGASQSAGGDDIFVAMLDANSGEKIWTKQVGSSGDDRVARGGGIIADADGNAVVFGDTTGSFFRMRGRGSSFTSDLFLVTFNQEDGSHEESMTKLKPNKKNTSSKHNASPGEWFGQDYTSYKTADPTFIGMVAGVIVSALVLMISCFVLYRRTRARHELAKQNAIFTYLQQFSVEDIDLRKSPPGGWHGTYLNKLAHGVNTKVSMPETPYRDEHLDEDEDVLFETAKMLSPNVTDSLFMDTASTPNLGGYSDYSDADDNPLQTRNKGENKFSIV
eukprot:CAMPEP_0116153894 /NCGR_PEP_ID=MMETSP0329-20121206/21488_1 /TAXON_ID=697910 /ORGANISM="Pseudo-nitzschia arenysensis, Strain B593" /LENGTH=1785 /DNA_ID=CAMNT_0003650833 /DNA_START=191 /DNA_END=5549 /DNA_ORIENTATION=-